MSDLERAARNGEARYALHRQFGSAWRPDGSLASAETDRHATAAQAEGLRIIGATDFDWDLRAGGSPHPNGWLLLEDESQLSVKIVWLGLRANGTPRSMEANLIVEPDKRRQAQLYVAVSGSVEDGFAVLGWFTHEELECEPLQDFGFGEKLAVAVWKLHTTPLGDWQGIQPAKPRPTPNPTVIQGRMAL